MRILEIVFSQQLYLKKNEPKIHKNAQRYIFQKSSNLFLEKNLFLLIIRLFFSFIRLISYRESTKSTYFCSIKN